jgi:cobalt-precorrin 5A hydrolase/precorrin-3B C17-methyltransferase
VQAAADGDFVVTFYNPRSRGREWQLAAALEILAGQRPGSTPAGIVHNASRPGQRVTLTTLAKLDVTDVDMLSVVIVGGTASQVVAGWLVTPRGYSWAP